MKLRLLPMLGQALAYTAFAALVGYFASMPAYVAHNPGLAQIKVSFSHGGAPATECRRLTQEELMKIAPNMRRPLDCPRARVPVTVEIDLDGQPLMRETAPPSGLWSDGPSTVYARYAVASGRHTLAARLRDSRRGEGFDHVREGVIDLQARENRVIEFRADKGGFLFE
jgi:hypothetical protein